MCWICRRTKTSTHGSALSHYTLSLSSNGRCKRTRQAEQNHPVHHQNWPEHWDVEDLRPAAQEPNRDGSGCRMPELEFRQSPDEWAELVIVLGGEGRAIFKAFVLGEGRVKFRLQKREEEVQQVYSQRICHCSRKGSRSAVRSCLHCATFWGIYRTDVPSLRKDNSQEEKDEENDGGHPSVCGVRSERIEIRLVFLNGRTDQHTNFSTNTGNCTNLNQRQSSEWMQPYPRQF